MNGRFAWVLPTSLVKKVISAPRRAHKIDINFAAAPRHAVAKT